MCVHVCVRAYVRIVLNVRTLAYMRESVAWVCRGISRTPNRFIVYGNPNLTENAIVEKKSESKTVHHARLEINFKLQNVSKSWTFTKLILKNFKYDHMLGIDKK